MLNMLMNTVVYRIGLHFHVYSTYVMWIRISTQGKSKQKIGMVSLKPTFVFVVCFELSGRRRTSTVTISVITEMSIPPVF